MTKEQAIEVLRCRTNLGYGIVIENESTQVIEEALETVIKALEQEPILNKIKAEIMQLDYDIDTVYYDYNDMPQTETVHIICREEVLRIIDEYKEESEE